MENRERGRLPTERGAQHVARTLTEPASPEVKIIQGEPQCESSKVENVNSKQADPSTNKHFSLTEDRQMNTY